MNFADSLPYSAIELLALLTVGHEFATVDDCKLAVRVGERWQLVSELDLALLEERALVRFDENDPDTDMPRRVDVTNLGRDYLRRWELINRRKFTLNPPS